VKSINFKGGGWDFGSGEVKNRVRQFVPCAKLPQFTLQYTPLVRNLTGHGFFLSFMRVIFIYFFLYPSLLNKDDV
jgi:hypothetical protein